MSPRPLIECTSLLIAPGPIECKERSVDPYEPVERARVVGENADHPLRRIDPIDLRAQPSRRRSGDEYRSEVGIPVQESMHDPSGPRAILRLVVARRRALVVDGEARRSVAGGVVGFVVVDFRVDSIR